MPLKRTEKSDISAAPYPIAERYVRVYLNRRCLRNTQRRHSDFSISSEFFVLFERELRNAEPLRWDFLSPLYVGLSAIPSPL